MTNFIRKPFAQHTLILGGALLLGVIEFVALQRSSRLTRKPSKPASAFAD